MRYKTVKTPLYPGLICIADVQKYGELKQFTWSDIGSYDKNDDDEEMYAIAHIDKWENGNYCIYLVFNSQGKDYVLNTPGVIAHECYHAWMFIKNHIDHKSDGIDDESGSYFLNWIVDEVNDFLYGTSYNDKYRNDEQYNTFKPSPGPLDGDDEYKFYKELDHAKPE